MGRPNSGLERHVQAHDYSAEETNIFIRCRRKRSYKYLYEQGWLGEKTDAVTLRDMNRMKSNCSARGGIDALIMVYRLPTRP